MTEFVVSLSIILFRPLRLLLGPLHHRRRSLSASEEGREATFEALAAPWDSDPRWYRQDFPPRRRNRIRLLTHGDQYFTDLCQELRTAQIRVTIAAWALTPLMAVERAEDGSTTILAELLGEVSRNADVFVLLWSGASALFQPDTKTVEKARAQLLEIAPDLRCELDRTAVFSHDHHQKAVTIDGRIAYVGGMDLSTFQGDRWDTAQHPLRSGVGWHDVQVRLEGDIVEDVETNFCQRWREAVGDNIKPIPPTSDETWDTPCQLIRTIPRAFYPQTVPYGHFGIRHALLETIAAAQEFIYLENQYLWAPEIVDALCEAMDRQNPDRFRIVVVLPARAYDGRYDNDDHVRKLVKHDAGRGVFAAYTLYSSGPAQSQTGYQYSPIYVHSKTTIVDDAWLVVGSANLNRRGLATDSEIALQSQNSRQARRLRLELWSEHLGIPVAELSAREPGELIDGAWKAQAAEMQRRHDAGLPGPGWHVYPYAYRGSPQTRLLDHFQSLTLEH